MVDIHSEEYILGQNIRKYRKRIKIGCFDVYQ